jgi:hypothetical protein
MLFREIIAVYYENHTEHINTFCGQNAEFRHVKLYGTYSNHWALRGYETGLFEIFITDEYDIWIEVTALRAQPEVLNADIFFFGRINTEQ